MTSFMIAHFAELDAHNPGFAEVVVVPDVAASVPASPPAVIELEIAGKVRLRILLTTPPTLAAAMVKALGVSSPHEYGSGAPIASQPVVSKIVPNEGTATGLLYV
ncbi:hypothetical protein X765_32370 [Mesorhizobium sp. LSHC440B00]|nr:hypothetical protein [Mesorhizobium sp. LSHC440B00]ESX18453.1 hypothetical protein X765_32370 [Mesorhizobium sp. LSHC440B00]ESX25639.1 hypothetical protein X764_32615 [Mesorhizobium sp. LSHC440A00]